MTTRRRNCAPSTIDVLRRRRSGDRRPRWLRYRSARTCMRAGHGHMLGLIWWFYSDLKAYRANPTTRRRTDLRARFASHLQAPAAGTVTRDRLLQELSAKLPFNCCRCSTCPLECRGTSGERLGEPYSLSASPSARSAAASRVDASRRLPRCLSTRSGDTLMRYKLGIAFSRQDLGVPLAIRGNQPVPLRPGLVSSRCRSPGTPELLQLASSGKLPKPLKISSFEL